MIGVIDPAFLLHRSSADVEKDIDGVIRICQRHNVFIEPIAEYWPRMWKELGSKLEPTLQHSGKQALQQLRQLGSRSHVTLPVSSAAHAKAWRRGFQQLFAQTVMGACWEANIAAALVRVLCAGQDAILLTRRMPGRNVRVHAASHSTIHENTRWVLHISFKEIGPRQIRCIHNGRNLSVPWTIRFDFRLPSEQDQSIYPFCPPDQWWKASITAVRTTHSKPAWRDRHENGWCRPNIPDGAGYHWDVFLSQKCSNLVGLDQINVVEFGSTQGTPGTLHHVPTDKAGKIATSGWNCKQ